MSTSITNLIVRLVAAAVGANVAGGLLKAVPSPPGGVGRPRNVRRLASLVILPLLAFVAPVFAGFGTREVAPEVPDALSPVYFAAGTTQMQPRDMRILDGHAAWLRSDGKRVLQIEGHTDEPGDSAFSREVGDQRAKSVKAYLLSKGLAADRITTVSHGGGRPTCGEKTSTCRALNRRVSFSPGVLP